MKARDLFPGVRARRKVATLHLPAPAIEVVKFLEAVHAVWPGCTIQPGRKDDSPEVWYAPPSPLAVFEPEALR